jgi:hypothetical protein
MTDTRETSQHQIAANSYYFHIYNYGIRVACIHVAGITRWMITELKISKCKKLYLTAQVALVDDVVLVSNSCAYSQYVLGDNTACMLPAP